MKKILLALLLFPAFVHAQITIRDVLKTMPDTLALYLSQSNRLDMLDYYDAKMVAVVSNDMQGKSELVSIGSDSLVIKMNDSHDIIVYVLETEAEIDSSRQVVVICDTYKLTTGEYDRSLRFFSHKWRQLTDVPELVASQVDRLPCPMSTLLRRDDEVMKKLPLTGR